MKKAIWIGLAFVLLLGVLWKIRDVRAHQEAEAIQRRIEEQEAERRRVEEEARQAMIRQREAKRRAYVELVSQAAFGPLWSSPKKSFDAIEFGDQKQRLTRIYNAHTLESHDAKLVMRWSDIRRYAERGLLILYRIDSLEQKQPSGWDVIASLQKDSESDAWWQRLVAEVDKASLQTQFKEIEANLNDSIAALTDTIADLSLPDNGDKLAVTYFPSWRGTYSGEVLKVRNDSTDDLQDALLFVTVKDQNGETLTHVHQIDRWASGFEVSAQYLYGQRDYLNSQALEMPSRIDIVAVAQSGLLHGSYELTQQEWDTRVRGYLSNVNFDGVFLGPYIEDQTGRAFGPGFQFSFKGLPRLPVRAATIRFFSEGSYQDFSWDLSTIEAGKTYPVRMSPGLQPQTAELTLLFKDSNASVTIPSGAPAHLDGLLTQPTLTLPQVAVRVK